MKNLKRSFWTLAASIVVMMTASDAFAAQPYPWQLGFQDAASPVMERINDFHNFMLIIITAITLFVLALLVIVVVRFNQNKNPNPSKTSHNTAIEVAWTVVPILILLIIAVPSFRLLYYEQTIPPADVTVKAIGYQWFWGYEYPDQGIDEYSSIMLEDDELGPEDPRLLAVDNEVIVPVGKNVRVIVTAGDVIHNWAMPAFGVKKDAVPGRLNETWFRADREGVYYGMCSELCGVRHAFMPIAVRVVSEEQFAAWAETAAVDLEEANTMLAEMLDAEKQLAAVKDEAPAPTANN
ncbi:MAG: cytochrome c oxidase subunit II [Pseudomonadota bacterium]